MTSPTLANLSDFLAVAKEICLNSSSTSSTTVKARTISIDPSLGSMWVRISYSGPYLLRPAFEIPSSIAVKMAALSSPFSWANKSAI